MATVPGSYNVLIGNGVTVPVSKPDNNIVLGTATETVYMGGAQSGTGVQISSGALTLNSATTLVVSSSAGSQGQALLSGGSAASPYWCPAPVTITTTPYTVESKPAAFYIIGTAAPAVTVSLPNGLSNGFITIKNYSANLCTVQTISPASIVKLGATGLSVSGPIASGASAQLASVVTGGDTIWYVIT